MVLTIHDLDLQLGVQSHKCQTCQSTVSSYITLARLFVFNSRVLPNGDSGDCFIGTSYQRHHIQSHFTYTRQHDLAFDKGDGDGEDKVDAEDVGN